LTTPFFVHVDRGLRDVLYPSRAPTARSPFGDTTAPTRRYGVSTKPYSFTRANVDSEAMRPDVRTFRVSIVGRYDRRVA
jgi:hypothetical protein